MQITLSVPDYNPSEGIKISWVPGDEIKVNLIDNEVTIIANKEGFETLATQMLTLAQEGIPSGRHIHLTDRSGLAEGSIDLTIQKK